MGTDYILLSSDDIEGLKRVVAGMGAEVDDLNEDLAERNAYIADAQYYLESLRSVIHDGLTGRFDLHLKVALLGELESAEAALVKALA